MIDRKIEPRIIFEKIKSLVSKEVNTESYSGATDKTTNYYEQFMQAMGFNKGTDNDVMANFDKKSFAEQQETITVAYNLRHQLLNLTTQSDDVYNALLLLSYYFPLNSVTSDNKLICPLSNEIVDNKNSFVASNGYQYSKNYLLKNQHARAQLPQRDLNELESIRPATSAFRPRGENWDPLAGSLIFGSIVGGIGGFAAALTLAASGTAFFVVLGIAIASSLGAALLVPVAVLALWTIGYGIVKLYDKLNEPNRAEKLVFAEPEKPLNNKQSSQPLTLQPLYQPKTPSAPTMETVKSAIDPSLLPPVAYPAKQFKSPLAPPPKKIDPKIPPTRNVPRAKF